MVLAFFIYRADNSQKLVLVLPNRFSIKNSIDASGQNKTGVMDLQKR